MPYLKLIDSATNRAIEIREAVVRLGRSPDCTVVLRGDTAVVVSGVHAELRHGGGEWRVADLASRNGTFVNTRRIDAPVVLRSGDVISLGETGPLFNADGEVIAIHRAGLPQASGFGCQCRPSPSSRSCRSRCAKNSGSSERSPES